ncbi:hypothetical protein [Saccharospirillum alexandrii]|uniref:RipA family octameric membrane protein n=1 Tax=Saccharospirillum alexandrii TaxID=2448477 RepID=UPI003736A212
MEIEEQQNEVVPQMEKKELYKIAIETRNLEIGMFWQRSNYFMALNTAIAIGFFTQKAGPYGIILAALGAVVSLLWFFVNLGGKYWQSRWERRASIYEQEVAPDANLFSASKGTIQQDVEESLNRGEHKGFQKWLDKKILDKPSVSYQMMVLSFFFVCFWGAAMAVYIVVGKSA